MPSPNALRTGHNQRARCAVGVQWRYECMSHPGRKLPDLVGGRPPVSLRGRLVREREGPCSSRRRGQNGVGI
jgi:hypothetical protein